MSFSLYDYLSVTSRCCTKTAKHNHYNEVTPDGAIKCTWGRWNLAEIYGA